VPRRRKGIPVWAWLVVGVPAACGGAVALSLAARTVTAVVRPDADREGPDWNHKELLDHLNRSGLSLVMRPSRRGGAVFVGPGPDPDEIVAWRDGDGFAYHGPGVLVAEKFPDARSAHDMAGLSDRPAVAWGRFLIVSEDRPLLDRVRRALPD
jgi:hypothetical protein